MPRSHVPWDDIPVTTLERSYGVSFPMFAKIEVNGPQAHPLYLYWKAAQPGALGTRAITWNFTSFWLGAVGK